VTKEVRRDIIVGLDIGTSKILALAAELNAEGKLAILGFGSHHESKGLKRGVVVNIEETVGAISRAVQEVELMAGCKVHKVYTGIAGAHIKSQDSNGMTVVKDKEITQFDVERAIEAANATPISNDDQILHTLVQEFVVDGQDGVKEPIGMDAKRLDVKVHIVTGAVTAVQNIVKCVHRCGLEVEDLVLQPLASGHAVLTEDEKDVGVCLVDIGGGTTDIAIFSQGAIRHTAVIPIAGDQITSDIAYALRTSTQDAEVIKEQYGVALQMLADPEQMIEVPGVGERPGAQLSRQTLAGFIQPRVQEIFEKVHAELVGSGYERLLRAGVVLTGGSALMPGMVQLGEEIFHNTVKLGVPHYDGNLRDYMRNPRYSTAMGLLLEGLEQKHRGMKVQGPVTLRQVLDRMRAWFGKNF
jgi:cell division protein FtsA